MEHTTPFSKLLPLYIVIFIGFVGYSLMITIFTPMFLEPNSSFVANNPYLGKPTIALGIILSLYPLGQFLGSPIIGTLSDYFGRKPTLVISLVLTTIFYILIIVGLTVQSFFLLALGSFFAGLAEANIVTAQSAIADVTSDLTRTKYFGYIYMSASSAYIIGPLLGGKLADRSLVSWFNYATPFWVVFILLILTTIGVTLYFHETKKYITNERPNYLLAFTNLKNVVTDRNLRKFYFLNFFIYLAIFGFFRCYPMYLVDEFHFNVSRISEFVAWVGIPIVIANLWLNERVTKVLTLRNVTFISALCTGLFMLSIVMFSDEKMLWITLFLTSLALALCLPACASLLSFAAVPEEQGKVMGNNQALQVAAESLSGIIGGLLAAITVKLSLVVLAIVAMGSALLLYFYSL